MAALYALVTGTYANAAGLFGGVPTVTSFGNASGGTDNLWSYNNSVAAIDPILPGAISGFPSWVSGTGATRAAARAAASYAAAPVTNTYSGTQTVGFGTCAAAAPASTLTGTATGTFAATGTDAPIFPAPAVLAMFDIPAQRLVATNAWQCQTNQSNSYSYTDVTGSNSGTNGPSLSTRLPGANLVGSCTDGVHTSQILGVRQGAVAQLISAVSYWVIEYERTPDFVKTYNVGGLPSFPARGVAADTSLPNSNPRAEPVSLPCIPCCMTCLGVPF